MNTLATQPLETLLHPGLIEDGTGNLVGQVHRLLRGLIIEMRLLPNQTLAEKDVAACLAISKTPVREAFIRLAEERLIRVVPKSRTYVAPIDLDRFREGCFIRLQLETGAAEWAARERSLADVCRLKAALADQQTVLEREDYTAFRHADDAFHAMVVRAAGLPGVADLIASATLEIDRIRSLKQHLAIRRTERVLAQHRAIVDAIAARDPERAREAMQAHLGPVENKVWELGENPELWQLFEAVNREKPRTRAAG